MGRLIDALDASGDELVETTRAFHALQRFGLVAV